MIQIRLPSRPLLLKLLPTGRTGSLPRTQSSHGAAGALLINKVAIHLRAIRHRDQARQDPLVDGDIALALAIPWALVRPLGHRAPEAAVILAARVPVQAPGLQVRMVSLAPTLVPGHRDLAAVLAQNHRPVTELVRRLGQARVLQLSKALSMIGSVRVQSLALFQQQLCCQTFIGRKI